jgi:hypothetical protein
METQFLEIGSHTSHTLLIVLLDFVVHLNETYLWPYDLVVQGVLYQVGFNEVDDLFGYTER